MTRLHSGHTVLRRATSLKSILRSNPAERDAMSSLTDPAMMEGMIGGMTNQFVTMVPQMLIMGWVKLFFSGFVLGAPPCNFEP